MKETSMQITIKRPRRQRVFRTRLIMYNQCDHHHVCEHCAAFAEQAEAERPGHIWRIEEDTLVFAEDEVMEIYLGRKLKPTESVIHKNGNFHDCRVENLEVVSIEGLETK